MSKLSDDNRGSSTEMHKNDPRKGNKGGVLNAPVEYGQGHGDAGYCRQDNFAGKITDHGTFDPWYFEHHRAEQDQRIEDINSGKYFRDDDASEPAPEIDNGQTQRVGSADAPYPIHNWPANVPVRR